MSVEPTPPSPEIENLLAESRTVPARPRVRRPGQRDGRPVRGGRGATSRRSGRSGRASGSTGRRRSRRPSSGTCRSPSGSSAASSTSAYNCVDRHVERGLGDKVAYHWIGEPGDTRTLTYARPPARGQQGGQRAQGARRRDRRPGRDLHADDPRAADRDARLRPDRRAAHGRLRRLLAEALSGRINDCGAKVLITADGGWRRGKAVGLKHARRRGAGRHPDDRARPRRATGSATTCHMVHDRRPRRLVARHRRPPVRGLPAGPGRLRAHALPALHLGHDGQAQGHPAHDRRLPARARRSPTRRSSTSSPTTCTGAPPTSAG